MLLGMALPAVADPHPKGFYNDQFNGSTKPKTLDGITTFQIFDKQCSKTVYPDGRGESDCRNGNVRSALSRRPDEKMGRAVEYRFDIWVDPSFAYEGFFNDHSFGFLSDAHDSRLRIASWEGEFLHNFIYMLKLDSKNGISFLGKKCQLPKDFGTWITFSMKVLWSGKKSGWITVSCNEKIIYQAVDVATNQNPHCYITNQCEAKKKKNPKTVHFKVGPVMAGFGYEWKKWGKPSQFTDIQKEGIMIRMRNISVSRIEN
jgi:hypothetical protein